MGYTLTRTWERHDGAHGEMRRETTEGGETYAEAERRARSWWTSGATARAGAHSTPVVEIVDTSDRIVANVRGSGAGGHAVSPAGDGSAVTARWLKHLRDVGAWAERVRRSADRLSEMRPNDPVGDAGADTLDACAAHVSHLIYRVDDMLRHSWVASGGDSMTRLNVRRAVEATMDDADVDGYLALTTEGRIQLPPSTLGPDRIPDAVEALLRVSTAMLSVCEMIEGHAAGNAPERALAPGR